MILLTVFEPFTTGQGLELTHNPTADIALSVADTMENVRGLVLPVSYSRTRTSLSDHLNDLKPRVWVGLGFAPHRERLDIEAVALNLEHSTRPDNDGVQPHMKPIIDSAPLAYSTRLDVDAAVAIFTKYGVEAQPSLHAGAFLCNQTFFLGCHRTETDDPLKLAAFLHVPPMKSYKNFTEGLKALLTTL